MVLDMEDIKLEDLAKLGNFDSGKFVPKPRKITPQGITFAKDIAAVKVYSMVTYDEYLRNYSDFIGTIRERLETGEIGPRSGLGYAVLSEDCLNVSMWDSGIDENSPLYVIHPNIYTFEEGKFDISKLIRHNVDEVGPFCAWEADVFEHESLAWRRYFYSKRTDEDKLEYLQNFYQGASKDYPFSPMDDSIRIIHPSSREYGLFRVLRIETIRDLMKYGESELLRRAPQHKFGRRSLEQLKTKLKRLLNLELRK